MTTSTFSLDDEIQKMVRDVERGTDDGASLAEFDGDAFSQQPKRFEFVSFDPVPPRDLTGSVLAKKNRRVQVEIGRATLPAARQEVLTPGSVIRLDSTSDEAVDVWVDGVLAARGDLLVVDGKLAVRITERIPSNVADSV